MASLGAMSLPFHEIRSSSRSGSIPYEHYIYGGLEDLSTKFGNKECIKTLSIYHYENQRVEQIRHFCRGIGEYSFENYQYNISKNGDPETYYLTTTELTKYNVRFF